MTPSEHSDPEIRNRSNELLRAAGYRLEESAEQMENRKSLSPREIIFLFLLGILFSTGIVVFTHFLGVSAGHRNRQMFILAKWLVAIGLILQFIRLFVPLGFAKPKFVRGMLAFGNFTLAYSLSLLLVVAQP